MIEEACADLFGLYYVKPTRKTGGTETFLSPPMLISAQYYII